MGKSKRDRKLLQFKKMLDRVSSWTDGLGARLDPRIRKTVALYNLLGFTTSQSCEGHMNLDHGLATPWVDVVIDGNKKKEKALRNLIRSYWSYAADTRTGGIFGTFIYDDRLPISIRIQPAVELFYSVRKMKKKIPASVLRWYYTESRKEMKRLEKYLWLRFLGEVRGIKNPQKGVRYE